MPEVEFPEKDWAQYHTEFNEMGENGAEEFGVTWLLVNKVIRDAVMHAGVDYTDLQVKWLCFKIAQAVCYKLQEV